jgi:NAD(P)-dependent dehydrogenase (short-subunit alcohol dehydrogenase family)
LNANLSNIKRIPMTDIAAAPSLALITGATSGLGLACARDLLARADSRWRLLLASRNAAEGARVAAELNQSAGRDATEFVALDLGDLDSVRDFGARLRARGLELDALVCNAGLQFIAPARTAQGFEATFGVNHIGHFALTRELEPLLAPDARIIIVSSDTHDPKQATGMPEPRFLDPEVLARPETDPARSFERGDKPGLSQRRRYTTSKLCNVYFAYELDRRIRSGATAAARSVTVNAFNPGLMPGTGLARDYPAPLRLIWNHVLPALRPLLKRMGKDVNTPEGSGAALADMVAAPAWKGVTGRYASGRQVIPSSDESYDLEKAARLWSASEGWLSLGSPGRAEVARGPHPSLAEARG